MDRIAKALAAHDDAFAEIAHVLFGDGADELISKLSEKDKKFQRRQAQVGLASNAIGIAAGIDGTKSALGEFKRVKATPVGEAIKTTKIIKPRTKALAGAALGLQTLNVGGDLVANRVLARSARKETKVKKASPDGFDLKGGSGTKLKYKLMARTADKAAPKVKETGQIVAGKTKDGAKIVATKAKAKLEKRDELDIEWCGEISKVDDDKRQVFGFASVTKLDGEDVVDRQGDHISEEELEKAAYDYVHKSRKGGDMHERDGFGPRHVSDMIESMVFTDEKIAKMGLPDDFPRGWWVGYQIHDDETWNLVKSGKRQGFSIHGKGSRVSKVLS